MTIETEELESRWFVRNLFHVGLFLAMRKRELHMPPYIGSHWREDEQSECGGLEVSAVGLTRIYRKVQIDKRTIPIESIDHKAGGQIGTPRLEDSSPTPADGAKL